MRTWAGVGFGRRPFYLDAWQPLFPSWFSQLRLLSSHGRTSSALVGYGHALGGGVLPIGSNTDSYRRFFLSALRLSSRLRPRS